MQTTEQVAGEAREKLAKDLALAIIHASGGDPKRADEAASVLLANPLAALRAQPERGAEEMRSQIAGIIKYRGERARLAMQGSMDGYTRNEAVSDLCRALEFEIRTLPLHPAKDEGGGR